MADEQTNLQPQTGSEANAAPAGQGQQTETAAPAAGSAANPNPADANAAPADGTAPATPPAATDADAAKAKDGKGEDETKPKVAAFHGAPEGDYEAFTAPEGATLTTEVTDNVKVLAKELDLSQAGAQILATKADNLVKTLSAAQADVVKTARTEWTAQAKADKEFGGDNFTPNMAIVAKARDAFMTPGLKEVLDISGLGDHPEMIRAFFRIGKSISEDNKIVTGRQGAAGSDGDRAQRLWPNQK